MIYDMSDVLTEGLKALLVAMDVLICETSGGQCALGLNVCLRCVSDALEVLGRWFCLVPLVREGGIVGVLFQSCVLSCSWTYLGMCRGSGNCCGEA